MTAPVRHDLYVIYNVEDTESTPTTLRFPSVSERDQHIQRLVDQQAAKELTFQLVPSLKFVRYQAPATEKELSTKVREVLDPLISLRKVSRAPWFIDPKTGDHVKRHWEPGTPVSTLADFQETLELATVDRPVPRRRRPQR